MSTTSSAEWVWNPLLGVYYHAAADTYALPQPTGEWTYLTPAELAERGAHVGSTSASGAEKEEGEVEDDVGWGGLMDPEKLARVVAGASSSTMALSPRSDEHDRKQHGNGHDPYGRHAGRDREGRSATPTAEPAHILRLVVRRSKALPVGGVALLDARQGGIQIGRDRRGPGDAARLRVREMEVSKVHAVVYWGRQGRVDAAVRQSLSGKGEDRRQLGPGLPYEDEQNTGDGRNTAIEGRDQAPKAAGDEEGWWIVDLGSTLGTYVAHPGDEEATRLSEAKHASTPFALRHLSRLTVGTTTFDAHVHADWPCSACQLAGGAEIKLDSDSNPDGADSTSGSPAPAPASPFDPPVGAAARRGQRQFKRKLAMDALRDTLLGEDAKPAAPRAGAGLGAATGANAVGGAGGGGYADRAAQRRRLHPPSPPRASTRDGAGSISAPPMPLGPSAASRAMLARQGWTEGAGLGRDAQGRAEPVVAVMRNERVGLGARGQVADQGGEGDWKSRGRQRRWDEVARS